MKSRLLSRRTYGELLAETSVNELLAPGADALSHGHRGRIGARYRLGRARRGLRRTRQRTSVARAMVMDQPDSEPAQLVRILLARWDRTNLLTVLRQQIPGPRAWTDWTGPGRTHRHPWANWMRPL